MEGTIADAALRFPTPRPGEEGAAAAVRVNTHTTAAAAAAETGAAAAGAAGVGAEPDSSDASASGSGSESVTESSSDTSVSTTSDAAETSSFSSSSSLFPSSASASASASASVSEPALPDVDIVLALHACDTATDEALTRAVRWGAPLTLVSPCCHHDLQVRMRNAQRQAYPPLTRHGILRERLGDVVTDAFRAHILRLLGHRVDVVEWIGGEHTPRNTMIRAIKTGSPAGVELWEEYDAMCADWGVTPWLAEALEPEMRAAREAAFGRE